MTKAFQDLFHDTLKDIYFAEKKIMSALPKNSGANSPTMAWIRSLENGSNSKESSSSDTGIRKTG